MKIQISALKGQLDIKIAEIASLEQKVYLSDTELNHELVFLRHEVAKKNEEVELSKKMLEENKIQLEIRVKEVLIL